jgi:hypothetical protein
MICMIPSTAGSPESLGDRARAGKRPVSPGSGAECAFLVSLLMGCALVGCAASPPTRLTRLRAVEAAARPLLEMQPDANWTACYNRLLELGPASVEYVASRPVMQQVAAPDDLRVMLHTSLLRLLADPRTAPRLSVNSFETTLDVLHFNPKVRGRALGEVRMPTTRMPAAWHDLYPADFDQALACEIDVEGDRRIMLDWWRAHGGEAATWLARRRLHPRADHLWAILSRRYADVWTYEARPEVFLCSQPPGRAALFRGVTYDYNLVRAVCIWLGACELPGTQEELIELVAHPSEVVAYNARFALRHSSDPRIREVLERYKEPSNPGVPAEVHTSAATGSPQRKDTRRACFSRGSCGEQGSATHEVAQVHTRLRVRDRDGDVYRRPFRWD